MLSLIVLLPFLSALFMGCVYLFSNIKRKNSFYTFFGVGTPLLVTIFSFMVGKEFISGSEMIHESLVQWVNIGGFQVEIAFMADALSVVMISFITFIGTLIHLYASGYMKEDDGYGKFFSYFNLFMGSMLLLVLADNPIMMFIGWELVGLSSYLLIGFYHQDSSNITAANKAFILNRVGDFAFISGISLLFVTLEGSAFTYLSIAENISSIDSQLLSVIGLLLFIGAMGKSAQIPLYVWLPDAMAGPTPVSALIHAATMVTAGVYMVARYSFLYVEIPDIGVFIASIGAASALFAALIASYQNDIKKILAYSTMSQLGYMFIAVGLGFYSSGIFHVFTHAFFKALLFMGAGAVIVALHHEQNIFKMGQLKERLPFVYITMFIATLAISGIAPFAGFFSKDAILVATFASEHYVIWAIGSFTVFLTAFYMFRLFFSVFHARESEQKELKELPNSMTKPLLVLAIGSTFAGFLGVNEAYGGSAILNSFLSLPDKTFQINHSVEYTLSFVNTLLAFVGIFYAYKKFARDKKIIDEENLFNKLLVNKFYIDELYQYFIVKPLLFLSSCIVNIIDPKIFDGVFHLNVWSYKKAALVFAKLQTGNVRHYSLYILLSVSMLSLYMLYNFGWL